MLIYLDTMIIIYSLEVASPFHLSAMNRLAQLQAAGDQIAITDLTRMECRVFPKQSGDQVLLSQYDAFFAHPDVKTLPITTAVFDRATLVRAQHGFKTVDSIHLAAAVEGGCGKFLTNDIQLGNFPDIAVEILPP